MNYLAVVVAGIAAFVAAFGYYTVFGAKLKEFGSTAAESERMPPWLVPVELLRSLVVAAAVAWLAHRMNFAEWNEGTLLALALWIGFPVVLLTGSVVHERVPWRLAALHAGDWLVKLLVVAVIVSAWR